MSSSASWGAPPKARWVDYNHRPETVADAKAISRGWTWLSQSLDNLCKLMRLKHTTVPCLEAEVDVSSTAEYFGQ
eukprot:5743290-Pyramimonas_sp.AAC.1